MAQAPLGEMIIELGLDSKDFGKGLQSAKNEVKYWASDMKTSMRAADLSGNQLSKLDSKFKGLSKTIEAQKRVVQSLKQSYDNSFVDGKATKSTEKLARQLKTAEGTLVGYQDELKKTAKELAETEVKTPGWTGKLNESSAKLESIGGKMQTFGDKTKVIGDSLTKGVTVPLVGLGGAAVKAASDWETAAAGMRKTNDEIVDSSGKVVFSHEQLEQQIRSLAQEIPISAKELAGLAETAGQLGIESDKVAQFTEVVAKMGVATNMTAEDAATSMAKFLNVTGSGTETVSNLASAVVELGNNTSATESEIMEMSQRWATTGSMIGLADDQIVAISATLLSMGVNVEAGGSALQRFGTKLNSAVLDGGKDLETFAQTAGMSADEFARAWEEDPARAMESFLVGLDEFQKSGGNANGLLKELGITSVQEVNAVLALAEGHDQLNDALDMSADAYKENSALNEEAAKAFDTLKSKLQVLKNKVTDVLIEIGGPLVDALVEAVDASEPLIDGIKDLAKKFSSLDEETQQSIVKWGAYAAALGPVISTTGRLTSGFGTLVTTVGRLGGKLVDLISDKAGKKAMEQISDGAGTAKDAIDKMGNAGKLAGGKIGSAGSLAFNPWVAGAAVAVAAVAAIGYAIYHEATEPTRRHKESVQETDGAYQDWFDNVTKGAAEIDNMNEKAVDGAKKTKSAYEEVTEALKQQNKEIQKMQDKQWDSKWTDWMNGPFKTSFRDLNNDGDAIHYKIENLETALEKLGQADDEINRIKDSVNSYQIMIGNSFGDIANTFAKGSKVTDEWANGHIQALHQVAETTRSRLEEMRQSEIDSIKSNAVWNEEEKQQRIAAVNDKYDAVISKTKDAEGRITAILSKAADEKRQLTDDEVVAMMRSYQDLAEATGQSMSDMDDVQKLVGQNLAAFTSQAGLEALKAAGLIDESTQTMVANAETSEEKLNILSDALKGYGDIDIDPKELVILYDQDGNVVQAEDAIKKWNELTPESKQAYIGVDGNDKLVKAIDDAGLWNNMEFIEQFAAIDTNADDADQKISDLLVSWGLVDSEEEAKQLLTQTNADETKQKLDELGYSVEVVDGTNVYIPSDTSTPLTEEKVKSLGLKAVEVNGNKVYIPSSTNSNNTKNLVNQLKNKANETNGTKANIPTSTNADNSKGKVQGLKNKANETNGTHVNIPASTNANQVKGQVEGARNAAKDKSFTITGFFNGAGNMWNAFKSKMGWEKGTNFHPGGMAIVKDQKGGMFREMITLPSGEQFIPHGRNVMLPLPKGSKVLRASQTRALFPGLPQYAEGIGAQTVSPIIKQYGRTVNIATENNESQLIRALLLQNQKLNNNFEDVKRYNKKLLEVMEDMDFDVYMDEYKVTKRIDRRMTRDHKTRNQFNSRREGVIL